MGDGVFLLLPSGENIVWFSVRLVSCDAQCLDPLVL